MSTPVALIQDLYAAFGRGDLPTLLAGLSPDVQWQFHGSPGMAYNQVAQGPAEVERWFGLVMEAEDIQVFEPREFFGGENHVTVLGFERTRDRRSNRVFETPWIHLFVLRDGLVCRFLGMYDTAAVAAARA
ncbi:MAG: nuclear transport factor 2 family protein [Leptothrix sp. (in: b-proteobacteria)]